jgi:hypothetical protein
MGTASGSPYVAQVDENTSLGTFLKILLDIAFHVQQIENLLIVNFDKTGTNDVFSIL